MEDEVNDRRSLPIGELGGIATYGRSDDRENARADDCADAQGCERDRAKGFSECFFGGFRIGDQLVDGFGGEDLAGQCLSLELKWV